MESEQPKAATKLHLNKQTIQTLERPEEGKSQYYTQYGCGGGGTIRTCFTRCQ
jgi:hypothetical protein